MAPRAHTHFNNSVKKRRLPLKSSYCKFFPKMKTMSSQSLHHQVEIQGSTVGAKLGEEVAKRKDNPEQGAL